MKILMTGATGFVGVVLGKKLLEAGHQLHILTRSNESLPEVYKNSAVSVFEWKDTSTLPPAESISGINGVINLMGENIAAKRWSDDQKNKLYTSRVDSTLNLTRLINELRPSPLDFFVSASAVGFYPVNTNAVLDEESKAGKNFLAKLCIAWEAAAHSIQKTNRTVIIRTAVVLEKSGGALKKMLPPFQMGVGGPIGDGNHMMSWIHLDDLVNLYFKAATDNNFNGVYNAAAPHPVSNFDFTKELGDALHRPTLIPVPALALKIAFGEMSSVILDSQKVVSKRLPEAGFEFKYETIHGALKGIFGDKK